MSCTEEIVDKEARSESERMAEQLSEEIISQLFLVRRVSTIPSPVLLYEWHKMRKQVLEQVLSLAQLSGTELSRKMGCVM
jgi:hypothetical protein